MAFNIEFLLNKLSTLEIDVITALIRINFFFIWGKPPSVKSPVKLFLVSVYHLIYCLYFFYVLH